LSSAVAFGITTVAVAVDVYVRTGSVLYLGYTGLAQFVPILLLALPAGQMADRYPPKRVFQIALAVITTGYASLALLAWFQGPVWAIFASLTLVGTGRTFTIPARFALLRRLVPLETLTNAVSWNSTGWQVASVAGPVAGGLLLYAVGPLGSYALSAWLAFQALLLLIPTQPTVPVTVAAPLRDLSALLAGVRFVWSNPLMLSAVTLDLFAVLLGGATALLPVFVKEVLQVQDAELAIGSLRAAPALGAVGMALWIAHRPPLRRPGRALLLAVALFGVSIIGFGLSSHFWVSFVLLALGGAADNISVIIRGTLMQTLTPDHMRGRVAAVNSVFISSSNELGEFESGVTAELFGAVPAVVLGGIGTVGVVALCAWCYPPLWRLGPLHELSPTEAEAA
jgi:MFS family permease